MGSSEQQCQEAQAQLGEVRSVDGDRGQGCPHEVGPTDNPLAAPLKVQNLKMDAVSLMAQAGSAIAATGAPRRDRDDV